MAERRRRVLQFVLLLAAMSFFADLVYEGASGVAGPFPALLVWLYDVSVATTVSTAVVLEIAVVPLLWGVARQRSAGH